MLTDKNAEGTAAVNGETENIPSAGGNVTNKQEAEKKSFDELISGEYKADFETKVREIIGKRLKNHEVNEETLRKLQPFLEFQAQRVGKSPDDIDGIVESLATDSDFIDRYAEEHGYSPEEAKRVWKLESEHREMTRNHERAQLRDAYERLRESSAVTKEEYPEFSFENEMNNQKFARLVASGFDTTTAYIACHPEVVRQKTEQAAQNAAQRTAEAVAANRSRPVENGLGNSSTAIINTDPAKLTKEERARIKKDVRQGKRVTF